MTRLCWFSVSGSIGMSCRPGIPRNWQVRWESMNDQSTDWEQGMNLRRRCAVVVQRFDRHLRRFGGGDHPVRDDAGRQ